MMKVLKFRLLGFTVITTTLLLRCTLTTTRTKSPIFARDTHAIARDINGIVATEKIGVHGSETNTNGKIASELVVELINSQNTPTDVVLLKKISQRIAVILKQSLKDTADYTTYKILFVKQVVDGGLTRSDYTGQIYRSDELNTHVYITTVGDRFDSVAHQAVGKSTFTENDSAIIAVISDYNFTSDLPLTFKLFKEADYGEILVIVRNLGVLPHGNNYSAVNLKLARMYDVKELKAGNYKFEFVINDSAVEHNILNCCNQ